MLWLMNRNIKQVINLKANNSQQSWEFEGEPPKVVIKDSVTKDWILGG